MNIDHRNIILDVDTGKEVAQLPGDPWYLGTWSADGQYLTMSRYERGGCDDNHLAIWSFATQSLTEIDGQYGSWSSSGHNLAYTRRLEVPPNPDDCVPDYEVRIRAADTNMDRSVGKGHGDLLNWSPNDRYLVVGLIGSTPDEERHGFRVIDTAEASYTDIDGSWFGEWLDAQTLFFIGNICSTFDFYTIKSDGSNLQSLPKLRVQMRGALTPQRDKIAFTESGEGQDSNSLIVYSFASGDETQYAVGPLRTGWIFGGGSNGWSNDARCLQIFAPAGKGGPCEFDPPYALSIERH